MRAPSSPARRRDAARALAAVVLSVALTALTACAGNNATSNGVSGDTVSRANKDLVENTDKPVLGGKIVYGLNAETNGWNPSTNQWATAGLQVAHTIFDTLTAFDASSDVHPYLAESYTPNDDFTVWTFKLRPNITFHNGRPVTADAVVRNQRYLSTSPVTSGAYYYVDSFSVVDTLTFTVKAKQSWVGFPMVFTTQIGVVAEPDWLESNDSLQPIGTGPFAFDSWEINNKLSVKKNPHYWRTDADGTPYPYLDAIEFRVIVDDNSRGAALRAKDVDLIESFNGLQIQEFQQGGGFQILSSPHGETTENFIQLNTKKAPLDDVDARTALAYATDKKTIIDTMTGGFNEEANGPFSPSSPWYAESGYPQFDQDKAREYVKKVKDRHEGVFSVTLTGSGDPQTIRLQQIVQGQWAAVGVDVTLETVDQPTLIIEVVTGKYQATAWLQFDAPDPSLDAVWWAPELATDPPAFSLNFARNKDPQIGDALTAARAARTKDEAKRQYAIVQQRMAVDVPYLWLYHQTVGIIGSPRLVNMTKYTLPDGALGLDLQQGSHPLYQVWLKDQA
jgi:ABC-type transport system substrate-binding protein